MADLPQKLGKYEIRRELGKGAMGVVYEGWDAGIGRRVALKTVRRDQLEGGEAAELLSRFKREAQAAGRLNHPNVVAVYEYGEDEGTAFIAMEYIEGRELKDIFDKNERVKLPDVLQLMTQLLDAIGHAHANGIVHRDIKPANVFLLPDGRLKVGDFGIARMESSNLTQAGSVLGTPAYMSPEQFMGQTVDGRSDLFSAGVILYQFLTGEKPFTGQLTTIMHKVLKEDPIAPSELNVQVPAGFDGLIRKALAKRPDERFQNAQAFISALQTAVNQPGVDNDATLIGASADADATLLPGGDTPQVGKPGIPAAPAPAKPTTPSTTAEASSQPATPASPPMAAPPKRSPAMALAIVGGLAAVGLGAGAWLMLGKDASAPSGSAEVAVTSPATAPAASSAMNDKEMVITAVGYADPSDPRFANDPGLLKAELREDAKRQLVEKALALYVQKQSLSDNYELVRTKLLPRSNEFISAVLQEDPPQTGKDGLASVTTRARVNIRQVQQSLNQMSREERVEFIRNNGDPKISVAITTKPEEGAVVRSPVAENILKERIHSFGFRTWSEEGQKGADFAVSGEAKFKKLSAKLAASGITVEKTVLTSWTVKAVDKASGEEIYFNTQIPEQMSWATDDQALRDIGKLIGDEFSKGFFLSHFHFTGQKVRLKLTGLPDSKSTALLQREISGLRNVLDLKSAGSDGFDAELAGGGNPADLVASTIVQPLNAKLGKTCFSVAGTSGSNIGIALDAACKDPATLSRLDTLPPAALYEAPVERRKAIVKNPDTLRKLSI
ncbi:MAG: eukaryotic-like serine/threonine-protein kinase [Pseudomonadota bacterium]|nr:eukaryotic-like serine/threonine-protein kinase [Pseudomonadota bacterium]MDQ5903044.1 eukaryotic-like serine/threonine-protein kinase [Pseudomonadota bacterium]MDQ5941369.1 eukaryotic-like serine/threonine-protein kinase [Pseudomonadota bacterium]MDQ5945970.1 eukaryotic-like serine/threonine-protein kinase [Pseudomonadota bacterium]